MSRLLVLVYGVVSYAVFFGTYLYAVGFVGNVLVPKAMDSQPTAPVATALAINLGLLTLFAIQHSVMARPWFKRALLGASTPRFTSSRQGHTALSGTRSMSAGCSPSGQRRP